MSWERPARNSKEASEAKSGSWRQMQERPGAFRAIVSVANCSFQAELSAPVSLIFAVTASLSGSCSIGIRE